MFHYRMEKFVAGKSAPFHLSPDEKMKILKAAGYSLISMVLAGLLSLLAIPSEQLPLWIVPIVPLLNAFIYGMKLWIMDNRN